MRRRAGIIAGMIAATAILAAGAPTAQAKVCSFNSCSTAINGWKAAKICDGDADGNSVESNYYRDSGSHGAVQEHSGNGHCNASGNSTNLVYRHQAHQIRDFAPDAWSSFEYRY